MQQQWRVYAPEGRDTKYDHKMNLRNMHQMGGLLGPVSPLTPVKKQDYGDDLYRMSVECEEVMVVAREPGQRNHEQGIFDDLNEGIFLKVSDENHRKAEGKLVRMFL